LSGAEGAEENIRPALSISTDNIPQEKCSNFFQPMWQPFILVIANAKPQFTN
jgi:hypothetical protein